MSSYTATYFLPTTAHFRGSAALPVFYIEPDGWHGPGHLAFQFHNSTPLAEQVEIAARFAAAATDWHQQLAARLASERTAADELAEARAEIARLKGETDTAEEATR